MSVRDGLQLVAQEEGREFDDASPPTSGWRRVFTPVLLIVVGAIVGIVAHASMHEKVVAPLPSSVVDDKVTLYNTVQVGVVGVTGQCLQARCASGSTCCMNSQAWGYCCAQSNRCENDVCVAPHGACFPGSASVDVKGEGAKQLKKVSIGDQVLVRTAGSEFDYEPVLGFLHSTGVGHAAQYLLVNHTGGQLGVSANHILFLADGSDMLASNARVGDELALLQGSGKVVSVELTTGNDGMFAPFTASGTVVVDSVVASNYATHSEATWIPHAAIHTAFFPLRIYHALGFVGSMDTVNATADGVHPFAEFLREHVSGLALELLAVK